MYVCAPVPGVGRWQEYRLPEAGVVAWGPLGLELQVIESHLVGAPTSGSREEQPGLLPLSSLSSPFLNVLNDQCTVFSLKFPVDL